MIRERLINMRMRGKKHVKSKQVAKGTEMTPSEVGQRIKNFDFVEKWSEAATTVTWVIGSDVAICDACDDEHFVANRVDVEAHNDLTMCPNCNFTRHEVKP